MKGNLLPTVLACVLALLLSAAAGDAQSYIRSGDNQYSNPLCNCDGVYIRKGDSVYSTALYNYDGKYLRKGTGKYSEPLLNISGTVPIAILILLTLQ